MFKYPLNQIHSVVRDAAAAAHREASREWPVVRSRGRYIYSTTADGEYYGFAEETPLPRSQRGIAAEVERLAADPTVRQIWVRNDFDGADSVHDMVNGYHEPMVAGVDVLVWGRTEADLIDGSAE